MYLELVEHYKATGKHGENIRPQPPAAEKQIEDAEAILGVRFPSELCSLLLEMNGDCDLLLSVEEIVEYSRSQISENFTVGSPLFIAADGFGGLYGYIVKDGKVDETKLVFWDHETDDIFDDEDSSASSIYDLIKKFYAACYGSLA